MQTTPLRHGLSTSWTALPRPVRILFAPVTLLLSIGGALPNAQQLLGYDDATDMFAALG